MPTTAETRTQASTLALGSAVAVLTIAFYFIEHQNAEVSSLEAFAVSGDEMVERVAEGDWGRRLAFPALALFGAALFVRRDGQWLDVRTPLAWLLLAYLGWCAMSVFWSSNLPLTVRHVGVLLFCSVAVLGITRQFSPIDLCAIALGVTTMLILNSLRAELVLGSFRPLAADYRFSGTLHPNVQAPYCATMAVAAACLATRADRGRVFLWMLCATGLILLLLTKSRTVCAICVGGFLIYASQRVPWKKRIMTATAIGLSACAVAYVGALIGSRVEQSATDLAMFGRTEDAGRLAGRIPLWGELMPHLQKHPLLGYGYQTFWDPERIETFSYAQQWTVTDGHCAYLDASLDLGLIGGALFVTVIAAGIAAALRRYVAGGDVGYLFLLAIMAGRAVTAFSESALASPTTFVSFVMACGLAHLGFCVPESELSSAADLPQEVCAWQHL